MILAEARRKVEKLANLAIPQKREGRKRFTLHHGVCKGFVVEYQPQKKMVYWHGTVVDEG